MKILDRYVFTTFILAMAFAASAFVSMYVVVDLFSHMEDFTNVKVGSPLRFILDYYLVRLPLFFYQMAPVIALMAAMITFVHLLRHNELIPILNAGIPVYRTLVPVLFGVVLLAVAMVWVDERVLPGLAEELHATDQQRRRKRELRMVIFWEQDGSMRFVADRFDQHAERLENLKVHRLRPDGWEEEFLCAGEAHYAQQGGRSGWLLRHGYRVEYDRTQRPTRGRATFGEEGYFLESKVRPFEIATKREELLLLSFGELLRTIRARPHDKRLQLRLYSKTATPVTPFVLLFLGLPFILKQRCRSFLLGFSVCLVCGMAFFGIQFLFNGLGSAGDVSPLVGAWVPVLAFGALGLILFDQVRT